MRKKKIETCIKRLFALGAVAFMSLYPMGVKAATGDITIQLQGDKVSSILYSKTATMINGLWELDEEYKECGVDLNHIENAEELEEAARKLLLYAQENHISIEESGKKRGEHKIWLEDLEEGLYLITTEENETLEMLPTLISLPNWTGEEMLYDVTVLPKFVEKQMAPQTGWDSRESIYLMLGIVSFGAILCWNFCKHRQ